jgi:hypothetical protein
MAKRPDLTSYQKKIVNRYYEHRDTLDAQKLGDIIGDLYLTEPGKKADKLWDSAQKLLLRAGANEVRVQKIVAEKNVKALAELVAELG